MPPAKLTVEQANNDLRLFHQCGTYLYEHWRDALSDAPKAIKQELKRRNRDTWYKLRAFAHPVSGYSTEGLEELCTQCRENNVPWGVKHVIVIVRLPKDGGLRARVQREAMKKQWGANELDRAVRKRIYRRRKGGRRRPIGKDEREVLLNVETLIESWNRWYYDLARKPAPGERRTWLKKLSRKTRTAIEQSNIELMKLQDLAKAHFPETAKTSG
jgi:hypothetical protein